MDSRWNVCRNTIPREDGQRRWDIAYQFLVRWSHQDSAGGNTPDATASGTCQEEPHANRSLCQSLDHTPTTDSDS